MPPVYLNGELVAGDDASISIYDHGLLVGDGVFESVVIRDGRPFGLSRHLARLSESARVLGLTVPPANELAAAATAVTEASGYRTGKLRITVTAGLGPLGSGRGDRGPTVIVAVEEITPSGEPAAVVVAPWPKNEHSPLAGAKTISYAENVVALAHARRHGASEALFFNLAGELCEGTGSNIVLGLDGRLVTPPLSAGCLAGVTRSLVIETSEIAEESLSPADLARCDEAFLTSTTRGIQPISSVDGRDLSPCPGPLTLAATEALAAVIARGEP